MSGKLTALSAFGLVLAWWVIFSVATDLWERIAPRGVSIATRLKQLPRASVGMMLAHLGVAVFIVGVTNVRTHEIEKDVRLAPGDQVVAGDWRFVLREFREREGPNYRAVQGHVEVYPTADLSRKLLDLYPEKRIYRVQTMPMSEAAIATRLSGDLYVSLGEPVDGGRAWIVRIYVKPFVDWIWGGCVLMALGGLLAATDRRYRARRNAEAARPAAGTQGAAA
jgi:cytochrome c-type biogenesis protein CcmF